MFTFDELCCLITVYVLPYALWTRTVIIWDLWVAENMISDFNVTGFHQGTKPKVLNWNLKVWSSTLSMLSSCEV